MVHDIEGICIANNDVDIQSMSLLGDQKTKKALVESTPPHHVLLDYHPATRLGEVPLGPGASMVSILVAKTAVALSRTMLLVTVNLWTFGFVAQGNRYSIHCQ